MCCQLPDRRKGRELACIEGAGTDETQSCARGTYVEVHIIHRACAVVGDGEKHPHADLAIVWLAVDVDLGSIVGYD